MALEALHAAITAGHTSGPAKPADAVIDRLESLTPRKPKAVEVGLSTAGRADLEGIAGYIAADYFGVPETVI